MSTDTMLWVSIALTYTLGRHSVPGSYKYKLW